MHRSTLAVASTLFLAAQSATASISYLSQTRSLDVHGSVSHDSALASDFALFDHSISLSNPDSGAAGAASQTSSLGPSGIFATGTVSAQDGNMGTDGFGQSLLDVSFSIDTPTDYTLAGSWTAMLYAGGFNTVNAVVRFTGVSAPSTLFADTFSGSGFSGMPTAGSSINQSGTLLPGTYRLELMLSQQSQFSAGNIAPQTGSFGLTLSIPAPASACVILGCSCVLVHRRRTTA